MSVQKNIRFYILPAVLTLGMLHGCSRCSNSPETAADGTTSTAIPDPVEQPANSGAGGTTGADANATGGQAGAAAGAGGSGANENISPEIPTAPGDGPNAAPWPNPDSESDGAPNFLEGEDEDVE
jgi:hypothetical protein